MAEPTVNRRALLRQAALALVAGAALLLLLLSVPAGTLAFWEAWVWLAVICIPVILVGSYLPRHNPALLARRLRSRENRPEQRRLIALTYVWFRATIIVPGLDRRWGWSCVPTAVVLLADLLVQAGYGVFVRVLRENTHLSRSVEVAAEQRVISTGSYALVRPPMYAGNTLLYLATPVAPGSYWALNPAVGIIGVIVARIYGEERVLTAQLPGYAEYARRTRYRLVPALW